MNCLRKKSLIFGLLVSTVLLLATKGVAYADYSSAYLSPSSGTIYSDYSAIQIKVNSGSDEFIGVDLDLAFTGNVSFVSATKATICGTFLTTPGTGEINIACLPGLSSNGESYNGTVATLYFKSTGTGSSTFTMTNADSSMVITSVTGGTYTLSLEKNPLGAQGGGGLPDSGLFDDSKSVIVLGTVLILFGVFFRQINSTVQLAWNKMGEKVVNIKASKKESRDKKRKERFEKDF